MTGFILVAAAMMTFGQHYRYHEGDSLMATIMSIDKPTWFFWNQDRYGNLLPILFSPIKSVSANFYGQLFIRRLCGFAAIGFALLIAGDRDALFERFVGAWLLLVVAADGFVSMFFNTNIPQPQSCAVFALGLWLLERQSPRQVWRLARWPIVTAVFWMAFYVNLSLVFLMVPMSLILGLWRPGGPGAIGRPAGLAMILVAALAALVQSRLVEPHTPTVLNPFWNALPGAAMSAMSGINPSILFGLLLTVAAVAVLAYRPKPGAVVAVSIPRAHLVAIAVLVVTAWFFADTLWVQINANPARYYAVQSLFIVVLPATWMISMLQAANVKRWFATWPRPAWQAALLAVALVATGLRAGPPTRVAFISDSPTAPLAVNDDVPRMESQVDDTGPVIAVGSYWLSMPFVYNRMATRPRAVSYAITDHWEPMRDTIRTLLQAGRHVALVCLPPYTANCADHAADWSGIDARRLVATLGAETPLGGGGVFRVIDVYWAPP